MHPLCSGKLKAHLSRWTLRVLIRRTDERDRATWGTDKWADGQRTALPAFFVQGRPWTGSLEAIQLPWPLSATLLGLLAIWIRNIAQ